jgi:hypothetical protein
MVLLDAKFLYVYFIAAIISSAFLYISRLQAQRERSYWLTAEDESNESSSVMPGKEFSVTSL